jgi:hypothetical protein
LGLSDGDKLKLGNGEFECEYEVKNDNSLRDDCLALFSGGKNSNALTPRLISEEGFGAVYQELKVDIIK